MGLIPTGAERIIAARVKGYQPADMVLVQLGHHRDSGNPTVVADAHIAYDWRWVRDLDICLVVGDDNDWGTMAKEIAKQRPKFICVWNEVGKWGATIYLVPTPEDVQRPPRYWKYDLNFTAWLDFQNEDFLVGRRYARDQNGFPYATDSRFN